jgi:hypothetical protein
MAWNTFHFTLSPGHSMEPGYSWGDDHGPQMALPREFTGSTRNNLLTASSQSLFRDSSNHLTYFVDALRVNVRRGKEKLQWLNSLYSPTILERSSERSRKGNHRHMPPLLCGFGPAMGNSAMNWM